MHRLIRCAARPVVCLLLLLGGAAVVAPGVGWSAGGADPAAAADRQLAPGPERVLTRLLQRRSAAYSTGAIGALRRVYVPRSPVHRHDVAALRAWDRRGLTVDRAMIRVRAAETVRRGPGTVVLRVVDRLGPAVAVDARGRTLALPRDHTTAHRITLVRTPAGWRIAAVRALSG